MIGTIDSIPMARGTTNARAEQSSEQFCFWKSVGAQARSFVTVAVNFRDQDDDSDILAPRARRQKVLDMLDEPPQR